MTDDQHRIGALTDSRLAVAGCLERWETAGDQRPDPIAVADWLLDQLRNLGWRPPLDLTEKPALRPDNPTTDGPGYAAFTAAKNALAARRKDHHS